MKSTERKKKEDPVEATCSDFVSVIREVHKISIKANLHARLNYKRCSSSKFRSTVQKFLRGLYVQYFPYRERSALSAFLEHLQSEDSLSGLHCPTGKCYFIPFLQGTGFYPTMHTVSTQHLRPTSNFQHSPT